MNPPADISPPLPRPAPKISVITPALNCAPFLGQCIESVLGQEYANFEHIIMDGGSTDGTVDLLKRHPHLVWRSEPDRGEANALNKALRLATGDVVTWLDADDYLVRGAFAKVAEQYQDAESFDLLYGHADAVDEAGKPLGRYVTAGGLTFPILLRWWLSPVFPNQRAMYFRREPMLKVGELNETLHYSIDYEYWIRFIKEHRFRHVNAVLGTARERAVCKSRNTVPDQIQSHWRVVLPFVAQLPETERFEFWRAFCVHLTRAPWPGQDPPALPPDDVRLLKQAFAATTAEMQTRAQAPAPAPAPAHTPMPASAPAAPLASTPGLKIAGRYDHGQGLTAVSEGSEMASQIRALFHTLRPRKLIETGTFEGRGTTKIIASALAAENIVGARFFSIECNPRNVVVATQSLFASKLLGRVQILNGLSVPRTLLPSKAEIQDRLVTNAPQADIFIDHEEHQRAALYYGETDFAEVADDLLGWCLRGFDFQPDFLMLDSGGHMGHVEFNYVLSLLRGPCVLALDDIHHVKHHKSFAQIQNDPRFRVLGSSREKFGFCIAAFTPRADALALAAG